MKFLVLILVLLFVFPSFPGADRQKLLFANTARAINDAPREVQVRHIGNCLKADPAYGKGVAGALGIQPGEIPKEA